VSRGRNDQRERDDGLQEHVIDIRRCAKVVKGGRSFSFTALVVMGDGAGKVGVGYGKAKDAPSAREKASVDAKRNFRRVSLLETTIPHEIVGRYGAAKVLFKPARPGTGVIAGAPVRAVMNAVGVNDILTKSFGSNNPINVVKATMNALERLRTRDEVRRLRGVEI